MPQFAYKALQHDGVLTEGFLDASNRQEAMRQVENRGLKTIKLAEPVAKAKWKEIHDLVIDGMSLSAAMARSPETFPRVYVAMVEAGETGGFLDLVLAQIADFQSREKELKSKVMTALMYPIILLILALGVLIFLLVFFIPRFQLVFAGFNAELPLITQIIVKTSEGVRGYGLYLAVAAVVAFF